MMIDAVCGNAVRVQGNRWWNLGKVVKVRPRLNVNEQSQGGNTAYDRQSIDSQEVPRRSIRKTQLPVRYR